MENFEMEKSVQLVKEKEVVLSKITLDSNGEVLIDGKSIQSGTGNINEDFSTNNLAVKGNIMPSVNGTQNIGSPTNRFNAIYVNEAMLSTNTLYLGDTPVMGTNQDTILIKADTDQSITMRTVGAGATKVISESNVQLSTSGMNANVVVQASGSGSNANISATNEVNLNATNVHIQGNTDMTGNISMDNLTVRGNVVVNGDKFITEATTVQIADNIMELNKNQVGYGVSAGRAGIKIDRGDADAMLLVFDETDDNFKIGTDTALQSLSTKNYVDTQDALKADKIHTHAISDITGILPSSQLPIATSSNLGGVKAGTGINIATDGTISTTASGGSVSTWNTFNL